MTIRLSIEDIITDFPAYRVGAVVATGLNIPASRPAALDDAIRTREAEVAETYADTGMGDIAGIADWRAAYRAFGIKKTSYRCSVERLVRSCIKGRGLPAINGFVDAYNLVSVRHIMPLGADDLDKVASDLAFRYARPGDSFIALGDEHRAEDPPKDGEVVYADSAKVLCRRWNWYQDDRSPVTTTTTRAVITAQSLGASPLEPALDDLEALLREHCHADLAWAIADAGNPVAEID